MRPFSFDARQAWISRNMAQFSLDEFVRAARDAAVSERPTKATLALMKKTFADPGGVAASIGTFDQEDEVLFEDHTVSIWHVRFQPGVLVPPHDHQLPSFTGVYEGTEENRLYRAEEVGLTLVATKNLGPGDVLSLGADGIHAVQALNGKPSEAIHLYLGKLTSAPRSLFDWDTGEQMPFTDETFERLLKHV